MDSNGWISPSGNNCIISNEDYVAWLCCNATARPRECQIIWKDSNDTDSEDVPDVYYVRLYLNKSGVYMYTSLHTKQNQHVILWMNTSSYRLRMSVNSIKQSSDPQLYQ